MTNIYTGRSELSLWESCIADFRFYRNSLLNFAPGTVSGIGRGTNREFLREGARLEQGKVCGIPCVTTETYADYFGFPAGFDTVLGEDTAFSVEYLGWPQDRALGDYQALLGQALVADPFVGLTANNLITMDFGAGVQTSDVWEWFRWDAPLHMVVTRAAGDDPAFAVFCNSATVLWGGAQIVAAGNDGFTDAFGIVFNHPAPLDAIHPFYGHHLLLRVYNVALVASEVRYLFQRAQKLVPHDLFHIPIISV